jgi:hypothetical protein
MIAVKLVERKSHVMGDNVLLLYFPKWAEFKDILQATN